MDLLELLPYNVFISWGEMFASFAIHKIYIQVMRNFAVGGDLQ